EWQIISPDLTRPHPEVPESIGDFRTPGLESMRRRAVIYAVDGSPLDEKIIWAGTDDGLVHVTRNGGASWHDVTPPELKSWDKVSQVDAGHFSEATAYIAINAIRKSDMRPHIYKTHDGGRSWQHIVNGLPDMGPVNVVREDPRQPGLLYAGTEREVYFSIDDGAHWQSLRMNMPASSIRDLVIHENDLVIGTHGRSIWILDNISHLRELAGNTGTTLFSPPTAFRVRWNMFLDTPLPPEEPTGENPPDGAILDFYLDRDATSVSTEILDENSHLVRRFSSADPEVEVDTTALPHPTYWIRPPQRIQVGRGHHRFFWDLRHTPPEGARRDFSIAAVYRRTPMGPHGPFVHPGKYLVRLTVDGRSFEKQLDVKMDPRVDISDEGLMLQSEYSMACYRSYREAQEI
ncbi:MAG: glycoside hydrolase, partial [Saprospiraceae bacterium]|nr:glycoside hydrolase [Saprospiraceae bacterium]